MRVLNCSVYKYVKYLYSIQFVYKSFLVNVLQAKDQN